MNLNNIFNAFEDNAPLNEKAALLDFQKTQAFKLGMFKKIIWNQKNMDARLQSLKEHMPEFAEFMALGEKGSNEFITHCRAWAYLKDFNPSSEQGIDASHIFSDIETVTACNLAIHFWEEREEYEKCAHIKKVKDLLQKNLPM